MVIHIIDAGIDWHPIYWAVGLSSAIAILAMIRELFR